MNPLKYNRHIVAIYLLPIVGIYSFVVFLPLIQGLWYSLNEIVYFKLRFVGLRNYAEALHDKNFWFTLRNNFTIIILAVIFQLTTGFLIASLMRIRYILCKSVIRTVIFFPVVLSPVVVGLVWFVFYDYDNGILNNLLEILHLSSLKKAWLADPKIVIYAVAVPMIWQYIGLFFVIFSAGFSKIDNHLIEASRIDGANFFQILIHVVLPLMVSTWRVALVLCVSGGLKIFEHIFVMTSGGPGLASSVVAQYAYNQSVMRVRFDYASSIAILVVLISLILMVVIHFTTEKILKRYE